MESKVIFRFARKKIVLDCFTYNEIALQTSPIINSIKYMPEWWRKLPSSYTQTFFPRSTMKKCVGMVEYYRNSVALPLWSEMAIKVENRNYEWQFSDRTTQAGIHDYQERVNFMPDHGHIKILSPWYLKTKKDINWVWSQPIYNFDESISKIKILPGVINFYHQTGTNINLLFPLNRNTTYFIRHGQPMVHLTPMCEDKVEVVRHLISKKEFEKIKSLAAQISFIDKYKRIIAKREDFLDCPYHKEK